MLPQLQHLERDGEPVAQLVLDEVAGIAGQQQVGSFAKLAITLVNLALDDSFYPEFGRSITAARRRRGELLQITSN